MTEKHQKIGEKKSKMIEKLPVARKKQEVPEKLPVKKKTPFEILREYSNTRGRIQKADALYVGIGVEAHERKLLKSPTEVKVYLPFKARGQHLGCFGTTGAGKTGLIIHLVTQDILAGNNVLVIDPKGDSNLFNAIVEAAVCAGRFDELIFFSPIFPEHSIKLNLLKYYYMLDEVVDHVISGVKAKEEY